MNVGHLLLAAVASRPSPSPVPTAAPRIKLECSRSDVPNSDFIVTESPDRLEFLLKDERGSSSAARMAGVTIPEGAAPQWTAASFRKDQCDWIDGTRPVALCRASAGDVAFYVTDGPARREIGHGQAMMRLDLEQLTIDSVRPPERRRDGDDGRKPLRREDVHLTVFMKFGGSSTMSDVSVSLDRCLRYTPNDEGAAPAKEKD